MRWEKVREQQERELLQLPCFVLKRLIRFANTKRLVQLNPYLNIYAYMYLYLIHIYIYVYLPANESKVGDEVKFHGYYSRTGLVPKIAVASKYLAKARDESN